MMKERQNGRYCIASTFNTCDSKCLGTKWGPQVKSGQQIYFLCPSKYLQLWGFESSTGDPIIPTTHYFLMLQVSAVQKKYTMSTYVISISLVATLKK